MNRPQWEDYIVEGFDDLFDDDKYYEDLERYCDEVESKLEMAIGTIVMLDDKLTSIEKALDKASVYLASVPESHFCPWSGENVRCCDCPYYNGKEGDYVTCKTYGTEEQWKEWLLKDE